MSRFKPSLKSCLSQHGFTSSESYDYVVQCFLTNPSAHLRCMHIDGDCGRRRTAFAHALANSLQAPQVIYHEFGLEKPVPRVIRIQEGDEIIEEPPLDALDRIMTEACAQSEAEQTVLILDQLHKTPFLNHIRLYDFLQSGLWRYSDVQFQANKINLSVLLITDEDLYHSLNSVSFRLWVSGVNRSDIDVTAADLDLDAQNTQWLFPLQQLLHQLNLIPTLDEYQHLAYDIENYVLNQQQLKQSIFGWMENIDQMQLENDDLLPYLDDIIKAILMSKNIDEEIEISSI